MTRDGLHAAPTPPKSSDLGAAGPLALIQPPKAAQPPPKAAATPNLWGTYRAREASAASDAAAAAPEAAQRPTKAARTANSSMHGGQQQQQQQQQLQPSQRQVAMQANFMHARGQTLQNRSGSTCSAAAAEEPTPIFLAKMMGGAFAEGLCRLCGEADACRNSCT